MARDVRMPRLPLCSDVMELEISCFFLFLGSHHLCSEGEFVGFRSLCVVGREHFL